MTNEAQGRVVTLPNGQRRIDFIRNNYYGLTKDAKKDMLGNRPAIKKAINEMLGKDESKHIPYQIVFAATKLTKEKFLEERKDKEGKAAEKAKAKVAKEAEKKAAATKKAAEKKAADAKAKK